MASGQPAFAHMGCLQHGVRPGPPLGVAGLRDAVASGCWQWSFAAKWRVERAVAEDPPRKLTQITCPWPLDGGLRAGKPQRFHMAPRGMRRSTRAIWTLEVKGGCRDRTVSIPNAQPSSATHHPRRVGHRIASERPGSAIQAACPTQPRPALRHILAQCPPTRAAFERPASLMSALPRLAAGSDRGNGRG